MIIKHDNIVSAEIHEIYEFLKHLRPFDFLSENDLITAASNVRITYHKANSKEQILDYDNPTLFVVRSGIFDVRNSEGDLLDRVIEGGFFGYISLLTGQSVGNRLSVFEDGLLYRIDQKLFQQLRRNCLEFDQFFIQAHEKRLRVGLQSRHENTSMATKIQDIMSQRMISVDSDTSIYDAANLMSQENISSLLVLNKKGELDGIFTDKDIRNRVLIPKIKTSEKIKKVMTPSPISISSDSYVHEAVVTMIRNNIRHLPVVTTKHKKPISIVTLIDLIRIQGSDPVLIIGEIYRAKNVPELVNICHKIPELLLNLIKLDVRADDLGRILTSVTGALTRHLIHLAQAKYGKEPVPFVWIAFGSQGRQDQSAKSDQDNGLLLDNSFAKKHDAYFKKLAEFVCHGLDACGYVYCPGDIMAQNKKWRMSLNGWIDTFSHWITEPSNKALMHTSIFFDMRAIYTSDGAENLISNLQDQVLSLAKKNSIFLTLLTKNALDLSPPLGFFNRLVLEHNGDHKNTLDIKLRGMMPIIDIARIHALANGIKAVNTRERLEELIKIKAINKQDGLNLLDAQEYIAHQRLLHQGQQLANGLKPDNHLNPDSFSHLNIRHLKDAFQVVRDSQTGIKLKFNPASI